MNPALVYSASHLLIILLQQHTLGTLYNSLHLASCAPLARTYSGNVMLTIKRDAFVCVIQVQFHTLVLQVQSSSYSAGGGGWDSVEQAPDLQVKRPD